MKAKGMSLIELLVGAGIFVMLMAISSSAGLMIYKGKAKIQYTNELYSETRFMMERMIRDVRVNTIDYYEYFSQNLQDSSYSEKNGLSSTAGLYGENPGLYELFFYFIPNSDQAKNEVRNSDFSWDNNDRSSDINIGVFNTAADKDSSNDSTEYTLSQSEFSYNIGDINPTMGLFFLSSDGYTKTIYRYKTEDIGGENERGFIEIATMKLTNTASAPSVKNEWIHQYEDTNGYNFISITPPTLSVTNFSFILSPRDDPKKSFAKAVDDDGVTVQIQPHVVLKISAQLSAQNARRIMGENNEFTIQSSASSRIFHNVTFPRQ